MSKFKINDIAEADKKVGSMTLKQKEAAMDKIYENQNNMLAAVLVQQKTGSSMEQIELLLHILLVVFELQKLKKLKLAYVTENDQEKQMKRFVAHINFNEGLSVKEQDALVSKYIENHAEKYLTWSIVL